MDLYTAVYELIKQNKIESAVLILVVYIIADIKLLKRNIKGIKNYIDMQINHRKEICKLKHSKLNQNISED